MISLFENSYPRESGDADLVSFDVLYIANPEVMERFRLDPQLNKPDPTTFYGIGPKGFTDYPFLSTKAA